MHKQGSLRDSSGSSPPLPVLAPPTLPGHAVYVHADFNIFPQVGMAWAPTCYMRENELNIPRLIQRLRKDGLSVCLFRTETTNLF